MNLNNESNLNYGFLIVSLTALAVILLLLDQQFEEQSSPKVLMSKEVSASSIETMTILGDNSGENLISTPSLPDNLEFRSALVKNLATNFYFLENNIQQRWPMASLTKLLTAVVAYELIPDTAKVDNLVRIMMVVSDNQAAEVLADLYGREEFIQKMMTKAKELNMLETGIFDVTGLSFLNQSTAGDIEKLLIYIVDKHPKILQFSREKLLYLDGRAIPNINQFAGDPDFMGGKTGWTDEARGNLVSIFQYQGQPLLIVILGANDQVARFEQTKILFEWISKFYKSSGS